MSVNFGHCTSFKMDWKGAIADNHTTFGGFKIKQEFESEWPAGPQTPPGDLGIKTEPEFPIDEKIEPALKSELENDSMDHDDESINAMESGSEDDNMELTDVGKDLVKSELENNDMEHEDIKTGVQLGITELFTTREPCQTSSRSLDGRQDFKKSVKQTTNKNNARFHMNINKGVKLLTCKLCNYRTWKKGNLKVHKATHLTKKPSGNGRRGRPPKEHMQTDKWMNERPFECDECDYRGVHKDHLKTHMKIHYKKYFCNICGYRSKWKGNIVKHMPIHTGEKHSNSGDQGPLPSTDSAKKNKLTEQKPFICHKCDYQSNWKGNLTKHVKSHTEEEEFDHQENQSSNYSGKEKMYSEIKLEKNNDEDALESLYFCKVCSYGTTWKRELKKHLASHADKESLLCDVDGYQASQEDDLSRHKRSHQLKRVKPYKCNECDYRAHQESFLMSHKILHMKDKPFVCNVCGYRSSWKGNMTKHMNYCHSVVPSLNDSDRTHVEDEVNLKQLKRKYEVLPAHDKIDRLRESEQKNADPPAGKRATKRKPCSVCFREPKAYKFRCENCRWFWNSWKKKGCIPPDCSGHIAEGEDVDCLRCRWERYKAESLAWEEKNVSRRRKINASMGPIDAHLEKPIQPPQDEMGQFIELARGSSSETSNHQYCSVCFKYFPNVKNFRCRACRVFWSYWRKASKRPDCPGHTTEGEDANCSGCRWGRYKMVLSSLESEENSDKNG